MDKGFIFHLFFFNLPHGVEVVVGGDVVLVVAGEAELVAVALVDKVPELLGAERLPRKITVRREQNEHNLFDRDW